MTTPKVKPCPRCLDGGDPVLMTYEWDTKHVECLDCDLLGPGSGSKDGAVRGWNTQRAGLS